MPNGEEDKMEHDLYNILIAILEETRTIRKELQYQRIEEEREEIEEEERNTTTNKNRRTEIENEE